MRILELLLSNIYWVIVIGGFLLTMVTRSRAKQGRGQPRTPKMPSFGGGPDDREPGTWLPGRTAPREAREEAPAASVAPPPARDYGAARVSVGSAAPERGSLTAAAVADEAAESAARASERAVEPSGAAAAMQEADAAAVRQGVLWAEILGPPRARKPYSYRK